MPEIISKLSEKLSYNIEELEKIRKKILKFLTKNDIKLEIISQVELSVYEVLINILKYSPVMDKSKSINTDVVISSETVEVRICNYGDEFDLTGVELPEIKSHFKSGVNHGLGIYMIRTLMDEVKYSYEDNINCVTLIKNR